jgi:hypothetical protein
MIQRVAPSWGTRIASRLGQNLVELVGVGRQRQHVNSSLIQPAQSASKAGEAEKSAVFLLGASLVVFRQVGR